MARKKIWEIDSRFFCSISGSCLALSQIRRILKDSGLVKLSRETEPLIHTQVIMGLKCDNKLSRNINKALDMKYREEIQQLEDFTQCNEIYDYWQKNSDKEKVRGLYWAALSHPLTDLETADLIGDEMHMIIHGSLEKYLLAADENRKLKEDIRRSRTREREIKEERRILNENLKQAEMKLQQNSKSKEATNTINMEKNREKQLQAINVHLQSEMTKMENELRDFREKFELLEQENYRISCQLACPKNDYEEQITSLINEADERELDNKKVLLVGGRKALKEHCRNVICRFGGSFQHHDGGVEQSKKQLCSCARQADIVICALDCISHNACLNMKKICRNEGKRIIYLRNSGVESLNRELLGQLS